jgi:RecB family exonuclease
VITHRRTRLIRVDDLHEFRRIIATLCAKPAPSSGALAGPGRRSARAVIVGSTAAAAELRGMLISRAACRRDDLPLLLTRDETYNELHARLVEPPRRLSPFERDSMAHSAAHEAASRTEELPLQVRPRLVAEMLRFYDLIRRQSQGVDRFEALVVDAIGGGNGADDRGAERLLIQTRFLVDTFRGYEQRVRDSGACDEHVLRDLLLSHASPLPIRHAVVTVADWIADPHGLFVADFDLLARLPGLTSLDLVCTEATLGAGFRERVHRWWPGLEEVQGSLVAARRPTMKPALVVPAGARPDGVWATHRDREEELIAVARRLRAAGVGPSAWERVAVVFKRPLPYVYVAPQVFGSAGILWQTFDALPLAAEPGVAAVDLVLTAVETGFARGPLVTLLASPHLQLQADGGRVSREAIGALDRVLSEERYLGGIEHLVEIARGWEDRCGTRLRWTRRSEVELAEKGRPAIQAALGAVRALARLAHPAPASAQILLLRDFLQTHFGPPALASTAPASGLAARELRARAALDRILVDLAAAHQAHHDPSWTIDDLAPALRRWIEAETFAVDPPGQGVHLVDDEAARYGDFDELTIVGLIEGDWPEPTHRNIFYAPAVLAAVGWPSERDRRQAADARLLDLLASADERVRLSTFLLDDESLVARSVQLDEVTRAGLPVVAGDVPEHAWSFPDEELAARMEGHDASLPWLALRTARSPAELAMFHGEVGPQTLRRWSVSALETYLACPFKFFAQHILKLEEEPDDEETMDPRRQGEFLHKVFETFFRDWQTAGHGTITADSLDRARRLFTAIVDRECSDLPEGEAELERTRLLGCSAAEGLGDAVFRMEAERPVQVIDRLLEHRLEGPFTILTDRGPRTIELVGQIDRVDLLADGTFRLIDYKLGWPPDRTRALQLPIYGLCAEQYLEGRGGRRWALGEAAYLAFKGPRRVVPLFTSAEGRRDTLAGAQRRLADTVDLVTRGSFPPAPDDAFRCESCGYSGVCRKDYVGQV